MQLFKGNSSNATVQIETVQIAAVQMKLLKWECCYATAQIAIA
jgi:hypothetical protein